MTMDAMNERLERAGFKVTRSYDAPHREYIFDIEKGGLCTHARFKYSGPTSQIQFIDQIMRTWEDNNERRQANEYIRNDVDMTRALIGYMDNADKAVYLHGAWKCLPAIEDVIFNGPATIVKWSDGTKTVVKCCEDDDFDPEKGLAMAISKKALGDLKEVKKWTKKYESTNEIITKLTMSAKEATKAFGKFSELAKKFSRGL